MVRRVGRGWLVRGGRGGGDRIGGGTVSERGKRTGG